MQVDTGGCEAHKSGAEKEANLGHLARSCCFDFDGHLDLHQLVTSLP